MDGAELRHELRTRYELSNFRVLGQTTIGERADKEKERHAVREEAMAQYALAVEEIQEWSNLCNHVGVVWPKVGA